LVGTLPKSPFEHFAACQLRLPAPVYLRVPRDADAQQRWDGEGGNNGMLDTRRRRLRIRPRTWDGH
jgi:hypothetical protein